MSKILSRTAALAAALTRCGAGMSVIDEFTARFSAGGDIVCRPITPAITFKVECVYLEDRPPSRTAERFIEVFTEALDEVRNPKIGDP